MVSSSLPPSTGRHSALCSLKPPLKHEHGFRKRRTIAWRRYRPGCRSPSSKMPCFIANRLLKKAMKGYLTAHERVFRKTHDLDELARACEAIDLTLKAVLLEARDLTVFAWEFRYPGDSQVPSEAKPCRLSRWHGRSFVLSSSTDCPQLSDLSCIASTLAALPRLVHHARGAPSWQPGP